MTKEQQKQLDEMHTQLDDLHRQLNRHGALLEKILAHLVVDIPTALADIVEGVDTTVANTGRWMPPPVKVAGE